MRLAGKTAIVVGAGQRPGQGMGNGRAIALRFAGEGASVLCVDRNMDSAAETARLVRETGGRADAFSADIAGEDACRALVAEGLARYSRIDILVNNVGVLEDDDEVDLIDAGVFDRILAVNLRGMLLTIKHALPPMRAAGGGSIVNISSTASWIRNGLTAYELSKAAVNKLTETVAAANARYMIRCNAVLPGLIDTPIGMQGALTRGRSDDEARRLRDSLVALGGRMGEPGDVANAALFFASPESKFVTGALMPVDGGGWVRAVVADRS